MLERYDRRSADDHVNALREMVHRWAQERVAPMAAGYGRRALLVTGARSFQTSPGWATLQAGFQQHGLLVQHRQVHGEPSPHWVDDTVRDLHAVVRESYLRADLRFSADERAGRKKGLRNIPGVSAWATTAAASQAGRSSTGSAPAGPMVSVWTNTATCGAAPPMGCM